MTACIKIVNKYDGEDCYLTFADCLVHICDKDGYHIEDYNLFEISIDGFDKFYGIGHNSYLSPSIDTTESSTALTIDGVDEL